MHGTHHMLKSHVLRRRKNPPGCLQLMNMPEPLDPRMINDILLGCLSRRETRARNERNVSVNRIV